MAAYFVRTELANRESSLLQQADAVAGCLGLADAGVARACLGLGPGGGGPPNGAGGPGAGGPPTGPEDEGGGPPNGVGGRGGRGGFPGTRTVGGRRSIRRARDGRAGNAGSRGPRICPAAPGAPGSVAYKRGRVERYYTRQGTIAQSRYPGSEVLIKTSDAEMRFPADAKIASPPSCSGRPRPAA